MRRFHTLCGRLTERMALFPRTDFESQRFQLCPECAATVRAEFETAATEPEDHPLVWRQ